MHDNLVHTHLDVHARFWVFVYSKDKKPLFHFMLEKDTNFEQFKLPKYLMPHLIDQRSAGIGLRVQSPF